MKEMQMDKPPLIRAVIAGDSDLVQVLLDQGADPFIEDSGGIVC